ncbi:hypothetical protein HNQ80_003292 [Anaerosolibacter carboniphilus]|uniref:Lipoprotein n=1 Tax=Anaerosolibacter carboniphilus TaxID=1417629 RepID=A0A841KUX2_9FIRM|nr:hypothetical protein [Anaerosolibacter carboniphilus]MBB6217173.1 hypothetical protein [Anaerosolibacter carboniphilus]
MKKILCVSLLIATILTPTITGCTNGNIMDQYKQALEQTEKIQRSSELVEFTMDLDLSSLDLTLEEKKQLDMFSNIKGSFVAKHDKEKGISFLDGHIEMKNLGFDVKIYEDQETIVTLMPIFSKYMVIHKDQDQSSFEKNLPVIQIDQKEIKSLWNNMTTKSSIQNLGNKMVSTTEGEIRATAFEVTLQDAEIKEFAKAIIQIALKDPETKKSFMKFINEMPQGEKFEYALRTDEDFEEFLGYMEKGIDQMKINEFRHTGSFDKDHYIIEENVRLNYAVEVGPSEDIQVSYNIQVTRWNINKSFDFEMPVLTKENSFTVDQLNENTPKLIEDLLKSPKK